MGFYDRISTNYILNKGVIYHDVLDKAKKNKLKRVPHEWIFINLLYLEEIKKDPTIANKFLMYMMEYHPEYQWMSFDLNDPVATVVLESDIADKVFSKIPIFSDLETSETKAMEFGEAATDFLIRYANYSLVKCQNENIIITAESNCAKVFENELYNGYALQRKAKLSYHKLDQSMKEIYPTVDGYFKKLPVLPTKNLGIEIDELIEDSKGKFVKVR